ncbi:MAG TPA: glycine betaine ABC transporter substrate-binding protein [Capillimicrobium sp.]|jgi:glycine betaine/choline ABC-type transport system substrate-binding protein
MRRITLALLTALVAAFALAACGSDDDGGSTGTSTAAAPAETTAEAAPESTAIERNPDNQKVEITVGSKNFTEQKVLGEVYAQALEAAGYTVDTELNLGDEKTALKALEDGQIDAYPEYTGTALLSFFEVPSDKLPTDPDEAYRQVETDFAKDGIAALQPTPFTSSNEVALTRERAEQLGVTTISDLKGKEADLKLYGSPECRQRLDCLLGLEKVYGLKLRDNFTPVDIGLRHEVLENGDADLSIVFTTDPQIERNDEVLLEDDMGMFPPYNSTFLVKQSFLDEAGPDLQATVELVNQGLTAEAMQELNARVDLDKETPAQVASAYLQESGYVE